MKKFYIIWCPDSTLAPKRKFTDFNVAKHVAEDMCKKHSSDFYVMQALGYYTNK